jgi:hypothetical protein
VPTTKPIGLVGGPINLTKSPTFTYDLQLLRATILIVFALITEPLNFYEIPIMEPDDGLLINIYNQTD